MSYYNYKPQKIASTVPCHFSGATKMYVDRTFVHFILAKTDN